MKLIRQSAEVYLAPGPVCTIGQEEIAVIKAAAAGSPRGRARINAHPDGADSLHEMVIAIRPDSYIRPHKHPAKSEAFHIIDGAVDIAIFDDSGGLRDVVRLAADGLKGSLYYRMSMPLFHTLIIRSDILVVHEITNGPFVPGATIFAPFAPADGEEVAIGRYLVELAERVAVFLGGV
jgi:cupin fold WbuC family metalloprotein